MAKRIRYNIGDIFLIPVEEHLYGAGRILKKKERTVLIELFQIKPIGNNVFFDINSIKGNKPVSMNWCFDTAIKNGEWEIVNNFPLEREIGSLYFWTQDYGNNKYYLFEGTNSYSDKFTGIEISEEERVNYESYGIADGNFIVEIYRDRLISAGLLLSKSEEEE